MKIREFRGEYYFLSNFYKADVVYDGLKYKNNEAAFQSAKVKDIDKRREFCNLEPNESKRRGRGVKLRNDWEYIKDSVMEQIVRDKFTRNLDLRQKLIETADLKLEEGNTWGDKYWGVHNGKGKNKLGRILMKVREEIREEEKNL